MSVDCVVHQIKVWNRCQIFFCARLRDGIDYGTLLVGRLSVNSHLGTVPLSDLLMIF